MPVSVEVDVLLDDSEIEGRGDAIVDILGLTGNIK